MPPPPVGSLAEAGLRRAAAWGSVPAAFSGALYLI